MDIKKMLGDSYKEDMTADEVIALLEKSPELKTAESYERELEKMKTSVSKANAEAAESKRLLKEKMTAEELKAKEESEELAKLREERDAFARQVTVANYEKEFLSLGYDGQMAAETAEAMAKGDMQTVFKNHKAYAEKIVQDTKTAVLKDTPKMDGTGNHTGNVTQEQFDSMTYTERLELKQNNPQLFTTLNES